MAENRIERTSRTYVERESTPDVNVIDRHATISAPRDRIRWGPILAGLVSAIAMLLVLTVLGLALGASVFEPTSEGNDVGTFAAIYAGVAGLLAFFFGGWVTGRSAAVREGENAALNGFMVGATALALILWLTSSGLGNLLGGLGNNIADIARVGTEQVQSGQVDSAQAQNQAQQAADRAREVARANYDNAKGSAWGTLLGLALALGAATVGGVVGHSMKRDGEAVADGAPVRVT